MRVGCVGCGARGGEGGLGDDTAPQGARARRTTECGDVRAEEKAFWFVVVDTLGWNDACANANSAICSRTTSNTTLLEERSRCRKSSSHPQNMPATAHEHGTLPRFHRRLDLTFWSVGRAGNEIRQHEIGGRVRPSRWRGGESLEGLQLPTRATGLQSVIMPTPIPPPDAKYPS